ncbi:MAG: hypothetical protein EOO48_06115 [Flavobacterium sp.]|nr:MAG: hypothetical protein EOO48_06115 [Flavobacterium sp.]
MRRFLFPFVILIFFGCQENELSNTERMISRGSDTCESAERRIENTERAFRSLQKSNTKADRALLYGVANNFYNLSQRIKFANVLGELKRKCQTANDSTDLADLFRFYGEHFYLDGSLDSSFFYYKKAAKYYEQTGSKKKLATCYFNISSIQYEISDTWNAQLAAIKAFKYAKLDDNKQDQINALMMLGIISADLGNYSEALNADFRALDLLRFRNDPTLNRETCISNIGGVYLSLDKNLTAMAYFNAALKQKSLLKDRPDLYVRLLNNIATCKIALKRFSGIDSLYFSTLSVCKQNNFIDEVSMTYNHLSAYHLIMRDTVASIRYNDLAVRTARNSKNPNTLMRALQQGCKSNWRKASVFSQEYIKLSDSINTENQRNQNKFARIAFETDEITNEKDQAIKQKWIILIVAGIIFLLGALLFIIKMQRAKQKELVLIHEQQKSDASIYELIQNQQIKIDEGRQAEKKRISLELHDGVMNKLTSTRLNLFILNKRQDEETIKKCLTFIDDIQNIEKEIRKVAHDLGDDLFSGNKSFNLVLQSLFGYQKSISSTSISPEIDPAINWEIVDNSVKMNLYRILQEILNNCNKYAAASNIFITLTMEAEGVFTHTHDDGIGFELDRARKGIGLKNINQRVQALNGKLIIYSRPGEGTTISFFLPTIKS